MAMMAITISNSINVKPLARTGRPALLDARQRKSLHFMDFQLPRGNGPHEQTHPTKCYNGWTHKGTASLKEPAITAIKSHDPEARLSVDDDRKEASYPLLKLEASS
jgi:hypothetical protein